MVPVFPPLPIVNHVDDMGELDLAVVSLTVYSVLARKFHFERVHVPLVKGIRQVQPRRLAFIYRERSLETVRRHFENDVIELTCALLERSSK